jgi:hypothetical protein
MNAIAAKALFDDGVSRIDERVSTAHGWIIHERTFPTLDISFRATDRQELRLRLNFEDWNDTPPSVTLLSSDGTPLTTLPGQRGGSIFNASAHPTMGRPFVCMAGIREYHTHPSHVGELWPNHKGQDSFSLGGIVTKLWHGWRRTWP